MFFSQSIPSFGENLLGLARTAATRRDADPDLPAGRTYVTTPGSALLFPSLCQATGAIATPEADPLPDYCSERTAMMPTRRRPRVQDRATRIATERRHNRLARLARQDAGDSARFWPRDATGEDDPPPF